MERNYDRINPEDYKWGIFYYKPGDKRAIVPKRNMGLGYTLNFAQPLTWVIILIFLLFVTITGFLI